MCNDPDLCGLDVSTIEAFGQSVIVNIKAPTKIHYKGEQNYVMTHSPESHGYFIYPH